MTNKTASQPNELLIETIEDELSLFFNGIGSIRKSAEIMIEASAPEWLRTLLEQLGMKESEYQSVVKRSGDMARELQQTREENKRLLQRVAELEDKVGDIFDE